MTKLFLALMASTAISAAALAQQQYPSQPPGQDQPNRMQPAPGERMQQGPGQRAQPRMQPGEQAQPTRQQEQRLMSGKPVSPRTLKPDQVRMLQQALNDKGNQKIGVDGQWGPSSEKALRNFQRQQGMRATGRLDKQTLTALGASMPGEGEGPPPSVTPGAPPSGDQQQQQQPEQKTPEQPMTPGTRPQQ